MNLLPASALLAKDGKSSRIAMLCVATQAQQLMSLASVNTRH